ncbi:hypothetical protein GQ55_9G644100 [Panicum hallii var. hallii]|uniref:Myb-like domain-containing protein n=1 Tax=Panicum hallii var. hallii TaxID=1504633 RepID=A0A2T7CIN4_9POAL|nr:hypothetical protein GQ55_9G644100 [Panicum hallii var. hallii]PUZ43208.1 hypothetical protein GQ55_9G644100 [Panicum hallii var. hallii]
MQQPGMPPFSPAAGTPVGVGQKAATPAPAPPPISSRPPEGQQQQQVVDELGAGATASAGGGSSFADHEAGMSAGGDEGDRGGPSGNRWPRQETLALLKIRSEMDAAFREAALKGPLWEQVSRRLEAMGYKRSAKKCREKFENVDKYYKRTKDGRAGRGDGKAYRFFSELEALHGASSSPAPHPPASSLAATPVAMAPPATPLAVLGAPGMAPAMHAEPPPRVASVPQPAPLMSGTTTAPAAAATAAASDAACMMTPGDVSFSSGSDGEDTEDTGDGGKRKRHGGDVGGSGSIKMMRFFEGLMRQVMERQEEMQQRFIEAIEKREQDRMIREEAWRRQEVARLAREQDALAQERAMAASRDAAVVSFIQRVTGQTIPMPSVAPPAFIGALTHPPLQPTPVASAAPAPAQHQQPPSIQLSPKTHTMPKPAQPQPQHQTPPPAQPQSKEIIVRAPAESQDTAGSGGGTPSPSRWPKAEVHALIQLRTELEARYQDSGPKGPLWEDISAGMRRLGYNRSAKRCKEKWENINKYFKKVKESDKKRPEDSKTCPYYHQLDALYRSKALASSGAGGVAAAAAPRPDHQAGVTVLAAVPLSQTAPHAEHGGKQDCSNGNGNGCAGRGSSDNGGSSRGMQTQASNGRFSVEGAGGNGAASNKLQQGITITKETAATEPRPQPVSMNDSYVNDTVDSDSSMDDGDEEDEFDDDDEGNVGGGGGNSKMQYEIQFQRQQQGQSSVVRPNASGAAGSSGPVPAAATSGSFLTMVHH